MRKRDFQKLFAKYGANNIGSILGVTASTVRRWRTGGVPVKREREVKTLEAARLKEGYEEKSLREMMSEAQAAGKLPKPKNFLKRRDGERTTGYESSKTFKGFLSTKMLLEIRHHLETVPLQRALPNWLASVQMSVLAGDTAIYVASPVRFQVDHPEANDFIVEALESSGLQHSRREAIDSIIGKLKSKLDSDARFYVHAASFSTYQYKSQEEARELATRRRKERK